MKENKFIAEKVIQGCGNWKFPFFFCQPLDTPLLARDLWLAGKAWSWKLKIFYLFFIYLKSSQRTCLCFGYRCAVGGLGRMGQFACCVFLNLRIKYREKAVSTKAVSRHYLDFFLNIQGGFGQCCGNSLAGWMLKEWEWESKWKRQGKEKGKEMHTKLVGVPDFFKKIFVTHWPETSAWRIFS